MPARGPRWETPILAMLTVFLLRCHGGQMHTCGLPLRQRTHGAPSGCIGSISNHWLQPWLPCMSARWESQAPTAAGFSAPQPGHNRTAQRGSPALSWPEIGYCTHQSGRKDRQGATGPATGYHPCQPGRGQDRKRKPRPAHDERQMSLCTWLLKTDSQLLY